MLTERDNPFLSERMNITFLPRRSGKSETAKYYLQFLEEQRNPTAPMIYINEYSQDPLWGMFA